MSGRSLRVGALGMAVVLAGCAWAVHSAAGWDSGSKASTAGLGGTTPPPEDHMETEDTN